MTLQWLQLPPTVVLFPQIVSLKHGHYLLTAAETYLIINSWVLRSNSLELNIVIASPSILP